MLKHAYLILAHNNFTLLEKLLKLLDDERNDLFIHVDNKIANFQEDRFKKCVVKSNIEFVTPRIDVKWGHVNLVQAEFLLFRKANEFGHYSYYHLISGVDLPIKSQDYIHEFFEKNNGKELVGFSTDSYKDLKYKVTKIHIGTSYFKLKTLLLRKFVFFFDKSFALVQRLLGYNVVKLNEDFILAKGCNWVSVTGDFVTYLLTKETECLKMYKHSICPDEIFIHTVLYNSVFRKNILPADDEYSGCMRLIDWKRGNPYIYTKDDFEELISSDRLFARKFDEKDLLIVDMLYNKLKN